MLEDVNGGAATDVMRVHGKENDHLLLHYKVSFCVSYQGCGTLVRRILAARVCSLVGNSPRLVNLQPTSIGARALL